MDELRCPKCNHLVFKTEYRAKFVEGKNGIEIMCKCKRKLNIVIERL